MANRNTMTKIQKQIDELRREQLKIQQDVKRQGNELKAIQMREIIKLLTEKSTPNSARYRYTYDEIAEIMDCSYGTVANIAKENGLSRRPQVI